MAASPILRPGVAILVGLAAVSGCGEGPEPFTEVYESPVTAALYGYLLRPSLGHVYVDSLADLPFSIALNLRPTQGFNRAAVERDLAGLARAVIFEDSSFYASELITEDSLRALGTMYDVEKLSSAAADSVVAEWYPDSLADGWTEEEDEPIRVFPLRGDLYIVRRQWCRGWPCHGAAWVEVRRVKGGFAAFQVLLFGVE